MFKGKVILFFISVLFAPISLFSQTIIPMPVYYGDGEGSVTNKELIAILIGMNVPMILVYIVNSFRWLFTARREGYSFLEYVIWCEYGINLNTICFALVNGTALIVASILFVHNLL